MSGKNPEGDYIMYMMTGKNGVTVRRVVKSEIEEIYDIIKDDENWENVEIKWIPTTAEAFLDYMFSRFNVGKKASFAAIDGSSLTLNCRSPDDEDGIITIEMLDGSVRTYCSISEIREDLMDEHVVRFGKTRIEIGDLEALE